MCKENSSALRLLPEESLVKTGPVDYAGWSYNKSLLGTIQRQRFMMALHLLQDRRYQRLLEIGYGSGVFIPELASHADEVHGIDVHDHAGKVMDVLGTHGVEASLKKTPAESMDYPIGHFDCVIAMSSLEFVSDLDQVCREVRRVLQPNGAFIVITPAASRLVDFGLLVLTGQNARKDFGGRREKVIPTLKKHFHVQELIRYPRWMHPTLYRGLRLTK